MSSITPPHRLSLNRRSALALAAGASLWQTSSAATAHHEAAGLPAMNWQPWHPGRPTNDRGYWDSPAARARRPRWIAEAERTLRKGIPQWDDEAYQAFARQGQRSFDAVMAARLKGVSSLFLAHAATQESRYGTALASWVRDLLRQPTWVLGAHDPKLQTFKGVKAYVDLHAATLVHELALVLTLSGPDWEPDLQAEAREAIRVRALDPVLKSLQGEDKAHWWLGSPYNWIAVCLSGIAGAAMALEQDPGRRRALADGCARGGLSYLDSYGEDGYCEEGISYWNYGFSHYLCLRHTLLGASSGRVDLMKPAKALAAARFGQAVAMADGQVAAFGDAVLGSLPSEGLLRALHPWLGGPPPSAQAPANPGAVLPNELALMDACLAQAHGTTATSAATTPPSMARLTHFEDADIWVMRGAHPEAMSLTFKAGAKGRSHQHHDLGSYAVSVGGGQPCGDPGGPKRYEARTFNGQRFDSPLMNSSGHPVPGPCRQKPTGQARARILEARQDGFKAWVRLDLTEAYEWPGLLKLTREVRHDAQGRGEVHIVDEARFSEPQRFESVLVTDRLTTGSDGQHHLSRGQASLRLVVDSDVPVTWISESQSDQGTSWTVVRIRTRDAVGSARITARFLPDPPDAA